MAADESALIWTGDWTDRTERTASRRLKERQTGKVRSLLQGTWHISHAGAGITGASVPLRILRNPDRSAAISSVIKTRPNAV